MTKPGPKGPRPSSRASMIKQLIIEGKSDAEIRKKVQRKFPKMKLKTTAGKCIIGWYRWYVRTHEEA